MFPSTALNGPVGSGGTVLSASKGHQPITGPPDYPVGGNYIPNVNRTHVFPAGLASLFPNQDINNSRHIVDKSEVYGMPPTSTTSIGSKYGVPPTSLATGLKFGGGSSALKSLVEGAPPSSHVLNESEFPILSTRGPLPFPTTSYHSPSNLTSHTTIIQPTNASSGRAGYGNLDSNLMKPSPLNETPQSEFRIQNEDFPALPGAQHTDSSQSVNVAGPAGDTTVGKESNRFVSERTLPLSAPTNKKGIQTHPDGTVTGIPGGMLWDQFGMAGLLTFLRAIETDPGIVALALGHDLTTLGLNLSAPEKNLWQNFGGPWSESACRMQDMDYPVPDEYLVQASIRDKLPPIKLNRYPDDLLFYLFYNYPQDMFQMAAAAELYSRDWRYHKDERVWLTRAPGHPPVEQTGLYERGTYFVFEPSHWRKVPKEMILEYSKLEERPQLPPQLQQHGPQNVQT